MHTQQDLRHEIHSGIHSGYVRHASWLVSRGRADLVDLVADEFERRDHSTRPAPERAAG